MKLSKHDQLNRIKQILSSDAVTICTSCGFECVPMTKQALDNCPNCSTVSYIDPAYDDEYQEDIDVNELKKELQEKFF